MVFRTAATDRKVPINEAEAVADLLKVRARLQRIYGQDFVILDQPEDWSKSPRLSCDMVQSLYEEILKLPEDRASQLFRYLVSRSR